MDEATKRKRDEILQAEYEEMLRANGLCIHCETEMEATGSTPEYPDCNTWTCPNCFHVEPELGSARISGQ